MRLPWLRDCGCEPWSWLGGCPTSPGLGDYSLGTGSDNPGMNQLANIGPVQLMSVGFEPGANFEGRIADELAKLQNAGTIRLLDLLFVARDTDSDELVVLEHQEETLGAVVGALLGLELEGEQAEGERSFGMTTAEIQEMGAALRPAARPGSCSSSTCGRETSSARFGTPAAAPLGISF